MASSNIKLFDENKGNMLNDTEFNISTQRLNGLQTGVASSQLQNKAMYQASLMAYSIAQLMLANGQNANDTDAVSTFVNNLLASIVQKVADKATEQDIENGVSGKWIPSELFKSNNEDIANTFLKLAGGTMTGDLFLNADPTYALQAVTRRYVDSNYMKLRIGSYVGTGTYGAENPVTVTFPFPIEFFVFPHGKLITESAIACIGAIPTSFPSAINVSTSSKRLYVKRSKDNKSISWYSKNNDAGEQLNSSSTTYFYLYGGHDDEAPPEDKLIVQSGTFTVEKTGKYYIELYGGGGEAYLSRNNIQEAASGGSSCQSYTEVQLTAGEAINVVIGAANGGTTTFGSYSVAGGGSASNSTAGKGSGNLGKDGRKYNLNTTPVTSDGVYGSEYGYGGYISSSGSGFSYSKVPGGSGAVYIHYLYA